MDSQYHPEIKKLIQGFRSKQLHAAHSGRELMRVLVQVALDSPTNEIPQYIKLAVDQILTVLPAYAPPLNVIHRIFASVENAVSLGWSDQKLRSHLQGEAEKYLQWSLDARRSIARFAYNLIPDKAAIFTFTLSETLLHVFRYVWQQGKQFQVIVTESRPNNDGLETAKRLAKEGINVQVSIDASLGELIARSDLFLSGAEAIQQDGSAICKIGTYLAALVAREYGVPVYMLVDTMKLNVSSLFGLDLQLDPLELDDLYDASELESIGNQKHLKNITVSGSLFDQTPRSLIHGIVTERGVLSPESCALLISQMPYSPDFMSELLDRKRIKEEVKVLPG